MVAAVDRIGRRWMDTVSTLRDLRGRKVRVRSLAPSEQHWTRYFDADPDSPEAVIGDVLASFFTWAAQQELESIPAGGPKPAWTKPGATARPWERRGR